VIWDLHQKVIWDLHQKVIWQQRMLICKTLDSIMIQQGDHLRVIKALYRKICLQVKCHLQVLMMIHQAAEKLVKKQQRS
jgi:hypothetical protein